MDILGFDVDYSTKGKFDVAIDENNNIPMWIICGKDEGKTLVVTAGVHGCEYVGIESAKKIYNEVDEKTLKGTLIIFPMINKSGFYSGLKQVLREDNKNLNRVFPANKMGTLTDRIAYFFESKVYAVADFLLDLHSGDINEKMTPLVFCPSKAKAEVIKVAEEVVNGMPIDVVVPSTSTNGLYSCCVQNGTPAVLLEIGGLGQFSKEELKLCVDCIKSSMAYLGMDFKYNINKTQKISIKTDYLEAVEKGFWYQNLQVNKSVNKGDLLGELKDINGTLIKSYFAEFDGVVLYFTTSLGVEMGDNLITYGNV